MAAARGAGGLPHRRRARGGRGAGAVLPAAPAGQAEKSRADELTGAGVPALVVQGGRDSFGRPEEFPPGHEPVEVPYADHGFAVPKSADLGQEEAVTILTDAVLGWLGDLSRLRE